MVSNQPTWSHQELVQALTGAGLQPRRRPSDRDQVIVPLLDVRIDPPDNAAANPELRAYLGQVAESWRESYLHVVLGEPTRPGQVGVQGYNEATRRPYHSDEWVAVRSLPEAVAAFRTFWEQRDSYLGLFSGHLDTGGAGGR